MLGFFKGNDFNGGNIAPVQGQSKNLDANSVHSKSAQNAITPDSPGSWKSYRAVPVLDQARAFSEEEADALKEREKESNIERRASKRGFKSLMKIGNNQTLINRYFEEYRRNEGRNESRIQAFKNTTAKFLHSLRPKYASMGQNLQKAEQAADQAINDLMNQL